VSAVIAETIEDALSSISLDPARWHFFHARSAVLASGRDGVARPLTTGVRIQLDQSFVPTNPDTSFASLLDVDRVASCIPSASGIKGVDTGRSRRRPCW
jgi:hypothetical protein